MNIFRDKHDVTDAHAELIDDEKTVGNQHGRWCDPSDGAGTLL